MMKDEKQRPTLRELHEAVYGREEKNPDIVGGYETKEIEDDDADCFLD